MMPQYPITGSIVVFNGKDWVQLDTPVTPPATMNFEIEFESKYGFTLEEMELFIKKSNPELFV